MVKLMEMRRLAPLTQLLERLTALEESLRTGKPLKVAPPVTGGSSSPAGGGSSPAKAEPKAMSAAFAATATPALVTGQTSAPTASVADLPPVTLTEMPKALSPEFTAGESDIDRIKSSLEARRKMFLVTALDGARYAAVENGELYVEFAPEARHLGTGR